MSCDQLRTHAKTYDHSAPWKLPDVTKNRKLKGVPPKPQPQVYESDSDYEFDDSF